MSSTYRTTRDIFIPAGTAVCHAPWSTAYAVPYAEVLIGFDKDTTGSLRVDFEQAKALGLISDAVGLNKVVRLDGRPTLPPGEPDPNLVAGIQGMLELAQSGQLRSLAATGFCADGNRMAVWGGDLYRNVYEMAGALRWLGRQYEDRVLDGMPEGHHA